MALVVATLTSNFASAAPHTSAAAPPVRLAPPPPGPLGPSAVGSPATSTTVNVSNDWSWTRWSTGVGPSPRSQPMMVDDPNENGVLLFGGASLVNSALLNDTWLFHGGVWSELCSGTSAPPACPTSPSPRVGAEVAYAPADAEVVLFGGAKSFTTVNDTWVFHNGGWLNESGGAAPPSGDGLPMATTPAGGVLLITNRNHLAQTWEFHPSSPSGWTELVPTTTPLVGDQQPMWLDRTLGADLLWVQGSGIWQFAGGQWTKLTVAGTPPTMGGLPAGGGYDGAFGYGFVYAPTDTDRSTWSLANGSWRNITTNVSVGPPTTTPLGVTYDSSDGYVLAEEDIGAVTKDIQTWILHDPFTLRLNVSIAVRDIGQPASLDFAVSGGLSPYSTTVLAEPPGCGPPVNSSNPSAVPCVMTRTGAFPFTVQTHDVRDLYLLSTLTIRVDPALGASAFATPNPVTAGAVVGFSTNVSGGAPPYTVQWQIPGQALHSTPAFTTTFPLAGSVPVNLTVVDAAANAWSTSFSVAVVAPASLSATANPLATDVGIPIQFLGTGGTGAPPLAATWRYGDGTNGSSLTSNHTYEAAGEYRATVTVVDGLGSTANANVSVLVHPSLSVHPSQSVAAPAYSGRPVLLDAGIWGGTSPFVVTWAFGNGLSSNLTEPSPTFAHAGNTTVRVSVLDASGERANGTLVVVVGTFANSTVATAPGGSDVTGGVAAIALVAAGAVGGAIAGFRRRRGRASA
ncbi:MAG TPA: PKD domain-containing protein [Thermoplasmata archaeon]|nr:PKD domain-containing protein [Thermoplasmata archaeon]